VLHCIEFPILRVVAGGERGRTADSYLSRGLYAPCTHVMLTQARTLKVQQAGMHCPAMLCHGARSLCAAWLVCTDWRSR
jgi:hypothetical protein